MGKKRQSVFLTIAEGLDATVDGRGWGLEHETAKNLADAAPDLLEALEGLLRPKGSYSAAMLQAEAAIAKAKTGIAKKERKGKLKL